MRSPRFPVCTNGSCPASDASPRQRGCPTPNSTSTSTCGTCVWPAPGPNDSCSTSRRSSIRSHSIGRGRCGGSCSSTVSRVTDRRSGRSCIMPSATASASCAWPRCTSSSNPMRRCPTTSTWSRSSPMRSRRTTRSNSAVTSPMAFPAQSGSRLLTWFAVSSASPAASPAKWSSGRPTRSERRTPSTRRSRWCRRRSARSPGRATRSRVGRRCGRNARGTATSNTSRCPSTS